VNRLGFLENLLEHEVLEPALLRILEGPRNPLGLPRDPPTLEVRDLDAVLRQDDDLAVHHVHDAVRVLQ